MRDQKLEINEDWEREALKDFIYLHEEKTLIAEQVREDMNRKPALITVVDKDRILDKQYEHQFNPLPF